MGFIEIKGKKGREKGRLREKEKDRDTERKGRRKKRKIGLGPQLWRPARGDGERDQL